MTPAQLRLRAAYEDYMRDPNATEQTTTQEQIPTDTAGRTCSLAREKAARTARRRSRGEDQDGKRKVKMTRWTVVRPDRM
jgi:hypothetical protein